MPPIPQVLYVHEERLRRLEKHFDEGDNNNENTVDKASLLKLCKQCIPI